MLDIRLVLGLAVVLFIVFLIYYQVKERFSQQDPKLDEIRATLNTFFSSTTFKDELSTLNNGNIMNKLKFVKSALVEVNGLPQDQFSKVLFDELTQKRRELVGFLSQWTVKNAENE